MEATQRRLTTWIIVLALLMLGGTISVLAIGGRPDPSSLRAVAPLVAGPWKFHTGDDPAWAGRSIDDTAWETLSLDAPASSIDGDVGLPNYVDGWMAHGHPGYQGYAWYRTTLAIPPGDRAWDVLGPTLVEDGYELFWNGEKLGGSGQLTARPRVVGTRPMLFPLPPGAAGTRGVLALRVFMQPGSDASTVSGGIHVAPTLAPRPESIGLYRAEWWRTIAGYIVEAVEPAAMLAVIVLALGIRSRSSHGRFIAMACIALALSAVKRLDNAIVSWTDLLSLPTYVWLNNVLWMPLSLAAWALAWNHWSGRPHRMIDALTIVLAMAGVAAGMMKLAPLTQGFRIGTLVLLLFAGIRILRHGPMRFMAILTMTTWALSLYTSELGKLGVPTIWFPFGIGVTLTQYLYAVAIPLLALLIVRTMRPEMQERH